MFRQTSTCLKRLKLLRCGFQSRKRSRNSDAQEGALRYREGQQVHGFTVTKVTPVPDLFLTAIELSHNATGAQHLHLARDDSNNLFSVQFRTTPKDSTGVPHILEHTMLCGSKKYPCRDPFFKMLSRSLSTFMNAFTANDYTMYPFSTQNAKDFQNLLSVYLDAVFFPCLRELDFRQEGWRLENENPTDPNSPLVFKGIVFNEMKGAFCDNEHIYAQRLQNLLYPDHTYAVVSGGEPLAILDLTWDQLTRFHETHYHPSNARFFTYGDLPLEQHLRQIHEEALSRFERMEPSPKVPLQPHWDQPRDHHVTCGPDPLACDPRRQNTLCIAYLLGDITDTAEAFTLKLLSSLMVSGPSSPFYKALIEPKIGTDFPSVVGYNGNTRQASFTVGLQGVAEADLENVKSIICRTVDDIITNGFEEERIEAQLHKIEFQMKHQSTDFGLTLATYIAPCWNHDGDPVKLLQISESVAEFRQSLKDKPYFLQDKVRQYLKENSHRLTLSMSPDPSYLEKQAEEEDAKLGQKVAALSERDRRDIYEKGLQLLSAQSQAEDTSCLPALKVSDIEPAIPITAVQMDHAGSGVPVQYCQQPTNGLVYFRALCSLNTLPEDLKPYVPLFCSVITRLGSGALDYRQQALLMELKTGGFSVSPQVVADTDDINTYEQGILLTSSCLERNLPDMFYLWSGLFNSPHFDNEERLRTLVMMDAQELSNGISNSGDVYAMTRAARSLSPAWDLMETFCGMDQVMFMKRIAEQSDVTDILRKLPRMKRHLLSQENMRCSINATPQMMSRASVDLEKFMNSITTKKKERKSVRPNIIEKPLDPLVPPGSSGSRKLISEPNFKPCQMKTHFQLPFSVNYVGQCVCTVPYSHKDHASLCVLAQVMTAKFLLKEIREKGGAYGSGARMDHSGLFSFYSYRDPKSVETLDMFRKAIDWAKAGQFSQQDADEAKLSIFAAVDAPVAPSDKGLSRFLGGVSDELKQRHREQLFAVSHQDLTVAAARYLGLGQRTCSVTIIGPENEDIKKDPSWVIK
ncbi:presequence protease, mitochondrial-like isoform X1 [Arapaima gigas]